MSKSRSRKGSPQPTNRFRRGFCLAEQLLICEQYLFDGSWEVLEQAANLPKRFAGLLFQYEEERKVERLVAWLLIQRPSPKRVEHRRERIRNQLARVLRCSPKEILSTSLKVEEQTRQPS